jgi:hypothetical protein
LDGLAFALLELSESFPAVSRCGRPILPAIRGDVPLIGLLRGNHLRLQHVPNAALHSGASVGCSASS